MSESRRPVFTKTLPLRWGDMDAYGHVNNTVYFRFFEEARVEWLDELGFTVDGSGQDPIIVTTGATFLRELNYPNTIEVRTFTGKAGRSSLETFHEIVGKDDGTVYCEGYAKIVWFDHDSRQSIPLPEKLRALAANR